tara:strand:- start:88822 stop:89310 length:489 start_codon:yes stop_codon:yes gene_type:complete
MRTILFLDIDGVLTTRAWLGRPLRHLIYNLDFSHLTALHPEKVRWLQWLFSNNPDLELVYSTSWRKFVGAKRISEMLGIYGFKHQDRVVGETGDHAGSRSLEIANWLSTQDGDFRVITWDDEVSEQSDGPLKGYERLIVHTDFEIGITRDQVELTDDYLKGV